MSSLKRTSARRSCRSTVRSQLWEVRWDLSLAVSSRIGLVFKGPGNSVGCSCLRWSPAIWRGVRPRRASRPNPYEGATHSSLNLTREPSFHKPTYVNSHSGTPAARVLVTCSAFKVSGLLRSFASDHDFG